MVGIITCERWLQFLNDPTAIVFIDVDIVTVAQVLQQFVKEFEPGVELGAADVGDNDGTGPKLAGEYEVLTTKTFE